MSLYVRGSVNKLAKLSLLDKENTEGHHLYAYGRAIALLSR